MVGEVAGAEDVETTIVDGMAGDVAEVGAATAEVNRFGEFLRTILQLFIKSDYVLNLGRGASGAGQKAADKHVVAGRPELRFTVAVMVPVENVFGGERLHNGALVPKIETLELSQVVC